MSKNRGHDGERVRRMFHRLHRIWGPQHWWPADSAFEMIVGAYLTQNTAWSNVELALARLRQANVLSIDGVRRTSISELEQLVRPAGYFRQKAARLKQFVGHLDAKYSPRAAEAEDLTRAQRDDRALAAMLSRSTNELRAELLDLNGVGPETADSILLYAALHPIFVVDAYTTRIFSRHGLVSEDAKYEGVRALVENALGRECCGDHLISNNGDELAFRPPVHQPSALSRLSRTETAQVFAEFHGLLVQVGKHFCVKQKPRCEKCPLREFLPQARNEPGA